MGADKVLLFVRSIDQAEREVIGIELEDDDVANGLTEDWSEVERVCQRVGVEQSARAEGNARVEKRVNKAKFRSPDRRSVRGS